MTQATIITSGNALGTAFLINADRAAKGLDLLDGMTDEGLIDGSPLHRYALRSDRNAAIDAFRKGGTKGEDGTRVWTGTDESVNGVESGVAKCDPTAYDPSDRAEAADALAHIVAMLPPSQALAVRIAAVGLEGAEKALVWEYCRAKPHRDAVQGGTLDGIVALARDLAHIDMTPQEVRKATMACRKALQKARIKIADTAREGGLLDGVEVGVILGKGSGRRATRCG